MSRRVISSVLCIFLLALSSTASADTLLQTKFTKGETQKQKMTQVQNMTAVFGGQPPAKTEQQNSMNMEIICDDVTDSGIATLRHRVPRMQMTMQLPPPLNKKLEYDSDGPAPTDPILQQIDRTLRPMIGVDFSMKCDSQGKITDFVIPPKALDGLKASPVAAFGGELFSESGMKQMAEQGGVVLPEKAVKSGDKWTAVAETKSPIGTMKITREHTYLGPDSKTGFEKIGVTVKISLEPDPNPKFPGTITLKSGTGDGEIFFDNKLGRLSRSQIKMVMEMEITAGGQTIQQKIESNITVNDVTSEK